MLVNKDIKDEFLKIWDKNYPGSLSNAQSKVDCIEKTITLWGNILQKSGEMIEPASKKVTAAVAEFKAKMKGFEEDKTKTIFPTACQAFATELALGMTGYTTVIPNKVFLPAQVPNDSIEMCAGYLAEELIKWLQLGKATQQTSGATVTWL